MAESVPLSGNPVLPETVADKFKGINNRLDPTRLGLAWQVRADNALCDDAETLVSRPGQTPLLEGIADIYGTQDGRLLAVTNQGDLISVDSHGAPAAIAGGVTGAPFEWAELGYAIFAQSKTDQWAIYPDRVVPWGVPSCPPPSVSGEGDRAYMVACAHRAGDGRIGGTAEIATARGSETGGVTVFPPVRPGYSTLVYASMPDGAELLHVATVTGGQPLTLDGLRRGAPMDTLHHYPPPAGDAIASDHNRMVVGVWEPEQDRSILYYSRTDNPHLFRLDADFQIVAGRVTLLAGVPRGLVIGTDRGIHVDSLDGPVQQVAHYGVSPGSRAFDDRGLIYFWSHRGLCRAIPFQNMTDERYVTVARERGTAAVLPWQGSLYAVVSQRGEPVGNALAKPYTPLTISEVNRYGLANQQP